MAKLYAQVSFSNKRKLNLLLFFFLSNDLWSTDVFFFLFFVTAEEINISIEGFSSVNFINLGYVLVRHHIVARFRIVFDNS